MQNRVKIIFKPTGISYPQAVNVVGCATSQDDKPISSKQTNTICFCMSNLLLARKRDEAVQRLCKNNASSQKIVRRFLKKRKLTLTIRATGS